MTKEQINALIELIDAKIAAALDDGNSSDQGLITSMQANEAENELRRLLEEDNP